MSRRIDVAVPQRILIVRTDRIGDVILTTPAVKALRETFPLAWVVMLVSPKTRPLLSGNPYIDEIIVDDRENEHRGLGGYLKLIRSIRKRSFDLAIVFHTKKRTNLLCYLAGIPKRIGYANKKYGFLLTQKINDERHLGLKHESEYCLDLIRHLGVRGSAFKLYVALQAQATQWAEEVLRRENLWGKRVVAIHSGASCPTKRWPLGRFFLLMKKIAEEYDCRFILLGNNDESSLSRMLGELQSRVVDLTGQTDLNQLAALLEKSSLLVSNDSGPVHIAAGVGTPVISIFTRNQPGINPERWRPLGVLSRYVAPRPFVDLAFSRSKISETKNLERVEVAQVLEAVDALFKLC